MKNARPNNALSVYYFSPSPKPGKKEKRPIGIPGVADRALQRSVTMVLSAIYEEDFLPCSFGGRLGRNAHQALSTLNEIMMGKKVNWV